MAKRLETINELYSYTVSRITNPVTWQRYLNTACRNYRLPFEEQVLIFAQRPDATAVLPIDGKNGWNKRFGRWVNRGSTGIAVFGEAKNGYPRLKYYFDISDTHETEFSRPVPIWNVRPEYEESIIDSLENSFGTLSDRSTFSEALIFAAQNAVEDNVLDYLDELKQYVSGSFLEDLDELNLEFQYRTVLQNSVAYMLLARCGLDPRDHFTDDDFRCVMDFSTPETLNALGVATGDIGAMCLHDIARTTLALQRQASQENRTFASNTEIEYPKAEENTKKVERSDDNEQSDLHHGERVPPAQPVTQPGDEIDPWEIQPYAAELSEREPQGDVHESADQRQAEPALAGDPGDRPEAGGADHQPDAEEHGADRGTESPGSDAVGGDDEQHPPSSGGDRDENSDLRIDDDGEIEWQEDSDLPPFLNEEHIMAIIANKDDDLLYKKKQIDLFFSLHSDTKERAEYLQSAYPARFTELFAPDKTRIGWYPQADGLLMWEGRYPMRTKETVFSWELVAQWTGQLIDKKEYFINTQIKPPRNIQPGQLSFMDLPSQEPVDDTEQMSFAMPWPQLPQQIIDEALCIGANDIHSRLIICAYFMKDHPTENNAAFLQKHYKTNGAGFYVGDKQYALWYDQDGMRISSGNRVQKRSAALVTWADAAKRIRELLDLGRYMPKEELDRVEVFERHQIADALSHRVRDFAEAARQAAYAPILSETVSRAKIYPAITDQITELLNDPEMLQKVIDEWAEFADAYEQNHDLLRFHWHKPKELLEQLRDLQREPVIFHAAEEQPQRRYFISDDEIDEQLREHQEYRLDVYSYFATHPDSKEREHYLKHRHSEYQGYVGGNDNSTITRGAGLIFSHGSIGAPYASVKLNWNQITKRTSAMIAGNTWLSEKDREAMPDYERKQLAMRIVTFFHDVPEIFPRPFQANSFPDYWDAVKEVQSQLTDPAQVEHIYQEMMLPLWESTEKDFRYYDNRKAAIEAIRDYRNGTFSVYGRERTLFQLSDVSPVERQAEKTVVPSQTDGLDISKQLINEYAQEEFDDDADFSREDHVDLAFSTTSDGAHMVEIFADLTDLRLVYQVDKQTVHEIVCADLQELNSYLANLDFDQMIAYAEERFAEMEQDAPDTIPEPEPEPPQEEQPEKEAPVPIAPPKPRRDYVEFTTIHPEIEGEQRKDFVISDSRLGYGTKSEKYAANAAAIRCLKTIEAENRLATPEEQKILARYVGWGGLADCFDERHARYQDLKGLLDEDEYAAARASTLTAFYTSPVIINSIYQALSNMGFQTGNILEPSCGVGNFIGMLPDTMGGSKVYGVELDSISGRIAQQLYQNHSIAVSGFEKVQMPDSFFDVAVGNVPFGDFKVLDRRYDKHHWRIHDYFFGKTLDKVRPGGVVAFITSKGTMDKENSDVRRYLAQRADLVGAIRLPDTAFKANAGTEVTSDIIFLQKRDRITDIEPDWVQLDTDENGIKMNRYFVNHPEMIMGHMVMESTQYGMDSACKPIEGADLEDQLHLAIKNIYGKIPTHEIEEMEQEDLSIAADPGVQNFSHTIVDGTIYFRENSRMYPVTTSATGENRIRGMIALRDCTRKLIAYQTENYEDSYIQEVQEELNQLYDNYVKKYGRINSRGNSMAFSQDAGYYLLCSLEVLDGEGKFQRKADMFSKRTIRPNEPVTSVDTASEALAVSISEKACVDMGYMSELSGKTEAELESELSGIIFRDIRCAESSELIPEIATDLSRYGFVTADEYLSGNVRRKLRMAKALLEVMPAEKKSILEGYVKALENVQPVDLTAAEIGVRIGANWVPLDVYQQFLFELLGTSYIYRNKIKVLRSGTTGQWTVTEKNVDRDNVRATTTYGTKRMNAYHIMEQTLNQKTVRVFDYVFDQAGNKVAVLNKKETAIAQDRQELIKQKFTDWIWTNIDRREQLCSIYNETFNSIRPREYDGQHIRFPGMNPEISLRTHQVNAIAHIMYGGNTLLAHEVGAGKTFEMVAAAMEMKRLGLCTKSLIVVPNHIVGQWAGEWLQLYPSAKLLVAREKDFETANRKKFCARISTGDYDAIILGHSQFEKIPISAVRQQAILQDEIDSILDSIQDAKAAKAENYTIKQLERTRISLENRLEKLTDRSKKDEVITFEQLGVDRIFVDESHYFKNCAKRCA